jgi:hypothetical protein
MTKRSLYIFAVGTVVSLAAAAPAAAGGCCPGQAIACACPDMYLVNQGPVFSGPGAFATQVRDLPPQPPCCGSYPYVGFVYSGYPYGYYNDWVGAPYAGPRRYVNQRVYYRVKRPARVMQISK